MSIEGAPKPNNEEEKSSEKQESEEDRETSEEDKENKLEDKAKELEELNYRAEKAESPEEKENILEGASALEEEIEKVEKELGLSENELMKVYESMSFEEAEKELASIVAEAPGEIQENAVKGNASGVIEWLTKKGDTLTKGKLTRIVASLFILSMGVGGILHTTEEKAMARGNTETSEQYRESWQEKFEEMKELKEKYSGVVKENIDQLEEIAKDPSYRLDKNWETWEKKIRFKKLLEKAEEEKEKDLEGYVYDPQKREWGKDAVEQKEETERFERTLAQNENISSIHQEELKEAYKKASNEKKQIIWDALKNNSFSLENSETEAQPGDGLLVLQQKIVDLQKEGEMAPRKEGGVVLPSDKEHSGESDNVEFTNDALAKNDGMQEISIENADKKQIFKWINYLKSN